MTMHLFYGGPFSQWYPSKFEMDGVVYNCAEQAMMAAKAKLYGDEESLAVIMSTDNPAKQKAQGRKVKGYDHRWHEVAQEIVTRINIHKFSQSKHLLRYLLETGDDLIVEASPTDRIWGIGLSEFDPAALDQSKWRGTNWLGECIMEARKFLRGE